MSFLERFEQQTWKDAEISLQKVSHSHLSQLLACGAARTAEDFLTLISETASSHLGELLELSKARTVQQFGKTIRLFAPLYLSNYCSNICTYCGFSRNNKVERNVLSKSQALQELEYLKAKGFEHILFVTGESKDQAGIDYLLDITQEASSRVSHVSLEVQPLETDEYQKLAKQGAEGILVYQETYHQARYRIHHPKGKKSNFKYRLETPERVGTAGVRKIGLGILLGLEDWRIDSYFLAQHFLYLKKRFWKTQFSISFPRLQPATGFQPSENMMTDLELLQLIAAWRMLDPAVELVLSTRETPLFRDRALQYGVTTMSAGSSTEPGGYVVNPGKNLSQFSLGDHRSCEEFAGVLRDYGYDPVWKDWDRGFLLKPTASQSVG